MHLDLTCTSVELEPHPIRARINAWFFGAMDAYLHRKYGVRKRELFGGLPRTVLEIGAGAGTNLRYLSPGTRLIAVEPNEHMHPKLRAAAARHRVAVDVRTAVAERLPVEDASVDAVISSLVLCTVADPQRAIAEIRRVLRPGGRLWCLEHVAAEEGTALARWQRRVERPWRWFFEGCDTHRDIAGILGQAGFAEVVIERFTVSTAFLPVRPHIAAVALR